jgi:thiosulfate/3-mercaptopyruvate sulfurtransferase
MTTSSAAVRDRLLVSPAELQLLLASDAPPTVLDVRWSLAGPPGHEAYLAGHVPGSRFCDLDRDLSDPRIEVAVGGRHPLPDAETFGASMRRLGVSSARTVVVLDAADSTVAARAWWTLTYFGHRDVRVLDGGMRAWVEAGGPVEAGPPPTDPAPGDLTAVPGHLHLVEADQVQASAERGLLLDARAGERYRGEVEPVDPVPGHIPGARCTPTTDNVGSDGRFLSDAELSARFDAWGIDTDPDHPPVVYCGSGVTAAHEVLALALTGRPAALYAGSWSQWCRTPGRAVAIGAER